MERGEGRNQRRGGKGRGPPLSNTFRGHWIIVLEDCQLMTLDPPRIQTQSCVIIVIVIIVRNRIYQESMAQQQTHQLSSSFSLLLPLPDLSVYHTHHPIS